MRRIFLMAATAFLVVSAMAGCISTTIRTDWKDPGFHGHFKKVMVICLATDKGIRKTLEDDIVAQFTRRGVTAVPSYSYFPSLQGIQREVVTVKVLDINVDGILLVRTINSQSVESVPPQPIPSDGRPVPGGYNGPNPYGPSWYEGWDDHSRHIGNQRQADELYQSPATPITMDVSRVETSLYETSHGKIVWQALSDTYERKAFLKILKEFAEIIGKKLSERGLI